MALKTKQNKTKKIKQNFKKKKKKEHSRCREWHSKGVRVEMSLVFSKGRLVWLDQRVCVKQQARESRNAGWGEGRSWSSGPQTCVSLAGLLKRSSLGSTPRVSDSGCLGWNFRICISNKFPGDADAGAAGPGATL